MKYFQGISSFSNLKKQYRTLSKTNHPDRGGSTAVMQDINAEFEVLYRIWEHKSDQTTTSGYENDYNGASAKEYTEHVYREYRWKGKNYKGQNPREIVELIRKWLKETYPDYKFSLCRRHYHSIYIILVVADFEAFTDQGGNIVHKTVNRYNLQQDEAFTDRAKEVMQNVIDYAMSYNYDDSDSMTDYFDTNFYLTVRIGDGDRPYKIVIPKSRRTPGESVPVFQYPEGAAHKAMRLALGDSIFSQAEYRGDSRVLLGKKSFRENGTSHFWPLSYASSKTAQKRIDKLIAAGIECKLTGYNSGYIEFIRYSPELIDRLTAEDQTADAAEKIWNEKQQNK